MSSVQETNRLVKASGTQAVTQAGLTVEETRRCIIRKPYITPPQALRRP